MAKVKSPLATSPAQPARYDYEYRRGGTYNVSLVCELLAGKWFLDILETKTKCDWAWFLKTIAKEYKNAQLITLVMDNLNTHGPGALYEETFPPEKAKALWDQFEFVFPPKHGSKLNMAEIELNILSGQCLKRWIDNISEVKKRCSLGRKPERLRMPKSIGNSPPKMHG